MGRPLTRAVLAVALAAAVVFVCTSHAAAKRVALVIGNNDYRGVSPLSNPANDAGDVAAALKRLNFEVQQVKNGTFDDMRKGLLEFARRARGSEVAIVFYAGHGIEVGGENYLIPIDAELKADVDVDHEAIALKTVTPLVENASRLGLVILDACRNNPFASKMARSVRTRAVSRGLAAVEPTGNVLIAFSAREGTTAADGDGRNSPFTNSLLKHLETPGLEINFLFRNVRDEVMRVTKREQLPFIYGSLSSEVIYLKDPLPVAPQAPSARGPELDEVAWGMVRETRDTSQIERFLSQFPQSARKREAETRLAALQSERAAAEEAAKAKADAAAKSAAASAIGELSRSLQFELKRVGCFDQPVSGEFGPPARQALQKFAKFASVNVAPGDEISGDTLSLIRRFDRRVCPLSCRGDEKADGDRCIKVVCSAGRIAVNGNCVPDPNKQAAPATEQPAAGGTKCFTFNNRRFCE
ncbi:MAG: caspase family protein [Pseudorhodoplanes sp.]